MLEKMSEEIQRAETYAHQHGDEMNGAWYYLAHARKEWGHASQSQSDEARMSLHLGIVQQDLDRFWQNL